MTTDGMTIDPMCLPEHMSWEDSRVPRETWTYLGENISRYIRRGNGNVWVVMKNGVRYRIVGRDGTAPGDVDYYGVPYEGNVK